MKPVRVNTPPPQGNVPSVIGQTVQAATATLEALGFRVRVGGAVYSNDVAKGLVALASPSAGADVPDGSTITLYVSAGPAKSGGGGGGTGGGGGGTGGGTGPTGPPQPTASPTRRHGHGH